MKAVILLLMFPVVAFAQYLPDQKIPVKATVISDSGTFKGYLVKGADSTVILSSSKRYSANTAMSISAYNIRELHLKENYKTGFGLAAATFVLGFTVTAGLTKNSGDFDNDGKTSFFELILTAIEGTSSSNRRRRNTALIAGGVGGTAVLLAYLLDNKKLSLIFPLNNRKSFYNEKRDEINKCAGF